MKYFAEMTEVYWMNQLPTILTGAGKINTTPSSAV